MADILEGTAEFNRYHALVTGEVPITVSDDARLDMFPTECRCPADHHAPCGPPTQNGDGLCWSCKFMRGCP